MNWNKRDTPLTNKEFDLLPRNDNGDLIDLNLAYPFITNEQFMRLTGDDRSRMDDLDEETRCLMADANDWLAEFTALHNVVS